jgi:hypothetical protein
LHQKIKEAIFQPVAIAIVRSCLIAIKETKGVTLLKNASVVTGDLTLTTGIL